MKARREGTKHFTASILVENNGEFLLLFHEKLNMWLYPGGHVEPNEEPQDAALRELEEEAAIAVSLLSCAIQPALEVEIDHATAAELPMPLSMLCEKILEKQGGHHWHIDMIYLARASDEQRETLMGRTGFQWATPEAAARLRCPSELPSLMRKAQSVLKTIPSPAIPLERNSGSLPWGSEYKTIR